MLKRSRYTTYDRCSGRERRRRTASLSSSGTSRDASRPILRNSTLHHRNNFSHAFSRCAEVTAIMSSLIRPPDVRTDGSACRWGKRGHEPGFGRAILPYHQNPTIVSNGLRAVHGGEELRADGNFGGREGIGFFCRKRETCKEEGND